MIEHLKHKFRAAEPIKGNIQMMAACLSMEINLEKQKNRLQVNTNGGGKIQKKKYDLRITVENWIVENDERKIGESVICFLKEKLIKEKEKTTYNQTMFAYAKKKVLCEQFWKYWWEIFAEWLHLKQNFSENHFDDELVDILPDIKKKIKCFCATILLITTLSGIRITLRIWIWQDIEIDIYLICIFKVLENPCFLILNFFNQNGKFFLVIYNLLLLLMVNRTLKTFENVFIKRSQFIHSNLKLIWYIFKWKDLEILV